MDATQIEALKKYGKLWEKNGKSRIYFNDLTDWYGLKCQYYNSGNVSGATLDGDRISNSEARRIMGRLAFAKVWFDLDEGKFLGKDIEQADFNAIVAAIKAHIATNEPHPSLTVSA